MFLGVLSNANGCLSLHTRRKIPRVCITPPVMPTHFSSTSWWMATTTHIPISNDIPSATCCQCHSVNLHLPVITHLRKLWLKHPTLQWKSPILPAQHSSFSSHCLHHSVHMFGLPHCQLCSSQNYLNPSLWLQEPISSVQLLSRVWPLWPHGLQHARPPCPSPTPGVYSNLCPLSQWCHPTISSCHPLLLPPSIFPSTRVFSNKSALRIRWPKYWSFSFNISPSTEHSVLISFRIDWLDLLAVQGTPKSLLQHHSSKTSIFRCSAFFIVQLSHPYMTIGKTIPLMRWTFLLMTHLSISLSWSPAWLQRKSHSLTEQ